MKRPARKLRFREKLDYWLRHFKPIHLCWWFEKHGWKVPKYFIGTSSNYDLTHYMYGTDSGDSDPDAQTMGSEDDPLTNQAKETPFFIRFQIRETGGKAGSSNYWQLYYNTTNDPATASEVTTAGDGVVKIIDDPGSNITNFTATDTRLMSEFTGETYISGEYVDNADDTNAKYQLDSSDVLGYIEFMWCIQFESGAGDSTDYYFYPRCGDSAMDSHSVHPKVTTVAAVNPDVNMADENPDVVDYAEVVVILGIKTAEENPSVTDESIELILHPVDFNNFTEIDPGTAIEKTVSKILWSSLDVRDTDSRVFYDFLGNAFNDDFNHRFIFNVSNFSGSSPYCSIWSLTQNVDDGTALEAASEDFVSILAYNPGTPQLQLRLTEDGTPATQSINISTGIDYYVTIERDYDGGTNNTGRYTLRAYLYNYYGETGAVEVDTVFVDSGVGEQNDFRYLFVTNTWNTGDSGRTITAEIRNLEIFEIPITSYDDVGLQENSEQYINPYYVNQADENPDVSDYSNVSVSYAIKVDDDIGLTDEIDALQVLGINTNDTVGITDYAHQGQMSVYGSYYNVNLTDTGWLDVVRNDCYINSLSTSRTFTLNVIDPTTPTYLDEISDSKLNGAEFIELWGDIAYVTALYSNRFLIIDEKNTSDISIYNSIQLNTELAGAAGACIVENLDGRTRIAFVAAYNGARITALDISDKDNLSLIDSYYDATNLNQVINCVYQNGYLFCVARFSKKFTVLDVSDPDNISFVTALDDPISQRFERLGGITPVVNNRVICPCSTSDRVNIVNVLDPENPYIEGSVTHEALEGAYVAEWVTEKWCICSGRYTNTIVLLDLSDYTDPIVIDWIRDEVNLNGTDDTHWKHDLGWCTVATGRRMTVLKIPQLEGLVKEIDIYTDNVSLQEDAIVSVIESEININIYDDITVQEDTAQYLNIYLIQPYDEIGLQDEKSVSVPGIDVDISVFDYVYIHPAYRRPDVSSDVAIEDYGETSITSLPGIDIDIADENPGVTDESIQYVTPYLIDAADDVSLQDISGEYLTIYEIIVYDSLTVQDASFQYLTFYEIYVSDYAGLQDGSQLSLGGYEIDIADDLTIADASNQYLIVYEVDTNDELSLTDESQQYLTIYEISVSDDIGLNESVNLELNAYFTEVSEDLTVTDYSEQLVTAPGLVYINQYDDLTVQESSNTEIAVYFISASDDLSVEEATSSYLTIYIINQYEQITVQDECQVTEIGIGIRDISAYDELTVQENADLFMSLYIVSAGDNVTVEDSVASALDLFLISTYDQISLSEEVEAQINPYLINEYESINVSDYIENLIAFKSQEVNVAESVGITDYANAAYIVYPFLQAFLTVQATRSIIDVGQTMSELDVEDTPSIVSVTR